MFRRVVLLLLLMLALMQGAFAGQLASLVNPVIPPFNATGASLPNWFSFTRASNAYYMNARGIYVPATFNYITNNTFQGLVPGSPGTQPTGASWSTQTGITRTIGAVQTDPATGFQYVDIRLAGTYSGITADVSIDPIAQTSILASQGQTWTAQTTLLGFAPGSANIGVGSQTLSYGMAERNAGGTGLVFNQIYITDSNVVPRTLTRTLINASTERVQPTIRVRLTDGLTIDITIRVGMSQMEMSDTANPIILTYGTANGAPRFTYNGVTGQSLGLLIEEARTNLQLYSTNLTNAVWSKQDVTATLVSHTSIFGQPSTTLLVPNTLNSNKFFLQDVNMTAATNYTQSLIVESAGYDWIQMATSTNFGANGDFVNFNAQSCSIGTVSTSLSIIKAYSSTALTSSTCLIQVTATALATTQGRFVHFLMNSDYNVRAPSFMGNGTSGIYVHQAQIEATSVSGRASTPIVTTSATATRAAEDAYTDTMIWQDPNSMTYITESAASYQGFLFGLGNTPSNPRGHLTNFFSNISVFYINGNLASSQSNGVELVNAGENTKIIAGYGQGLTIQAYRNGVSWTSVTNNIGYPFTPTRLSPGRRYGLENSYFNSTIKRIEPVGGRMRNDFMFNLTQ